MTSYTKPSSLCNINVMLAIIVAANDKLITSFFLFSFYYFTNTELIS